MLNSDSNPQSDPPLLNGVSGATTTRRVGVRGTAAWEAIWDSLRDGKWHTHRLTLSRCSDAARCSDELIRIVLKVAVEEEKIEIDAREGHNNRWYRRLDLVKQPGRTASGEVIKKESQRYLKILAKAGFPKSASKSDIARYLFVAQQVILNPDILDVIMDARKPKQKLVEAHIKSSVLDRAERVAQPPFAFGRSRTNAPRPKDG